MAWNRNRTIITAAGALLLGAAGIGAATATIPDTANHSAPQPLITIDGTFKPLQELAIYADCQAGERADLTTSFGAHAIMSPAADSGALVGFVTAPTSIEPGPDEGYHTATVTCQDSTSATVRIPSGGNDSAMEPKTLDKAQ